MSQLSLLIIFGIIAYFLYKIDKRVNNLEQKQGRGYTRGFTVDVRNSVYSNKLFGKLYGVKSAEEGKSYKDWSSEERKHFQIKKEDSLREKCFVRITYLSSEDCFFLETQLKSGIVLKNLDKTLLYSEIVAGDPDGIGDHLVLNIFERVIKNQGYQRVISLTLDETYEDLDKERKTHIILDFPYQRSDMNDELFKEMGFKVDRRNSDYVGIDEFGDHFFIPDQITLSKNNTEIIL
jgi:hypothetical protein